MVFTFWRKEASMIPLATILMRRALTAMVAAMMSRALIELH